MQLQTRRLTLRDLLPSDLGAIHDLHSYPEVDRYNTLGIPETMQQTEDMLSGWIVHQQQVSRISYVLRMQDADTSAFVGLIALNLGKPKYRIAEVWYKILPEHWNQGYTTEALLEVLRFGFEDLQLHRIEAGCAVGNTASARVMEKVGMVKEGMMRKILPIRGEWVDGYFFAILEEEFNGR